MSIESKEIIQDVLFQKIGYNWHVFTVWEGEIYSCKIPDHIDPRTEKFSLFKIIEEDNSWPLELKNSIVKANNIL